MERKQKDVAILMNQNLYSLKGLSSLRNCLLSLRRQSFQEWNKLDSIQILKLKYHLKHYYQFIIKISEKTRLKKQIYYHKLIKRTSIVS